MSYLSQNATLKAHPESDLVKTIFCTAKLLRSQIFCKMTASPNLYSPAIAFVSNRMLSIPDVDYLQSHAHFLGWLLTYVNRSVADGCIITQAEYGFTARYRTYVDVVRCNSCPISLSRFLREWLIPCSAKIQISRLPEYVGLLS
jgi:hypothetical protein